MPQVFVQIHTTFTPKKTGAPSLRHWPGYFRCPNAIPKELRLQEDSRELAGMLMKNKPGTTMKGCNFLDLMVTWVKLRNAERRFVKWSCVFLLPIYLSN